MVFSRLNKWDSAISRVPGVRWAVCLLAAMLIALSATGEASAEKRTLKLYYVHTGERAEITYKVNGRYSQAGLQKLNRFLRDWRRNEPTKMDPRLFDVVWEAYRRTGSREYIHVISGYRSPATNEMLRRTRGGQAKKSQHMLGKAMDFYIPGVPLSKLRAIGFKIGGGGVGYYPRSGSPFVHLDVGNVRAWPRMSRKELVRLFPDGKTLHLPTDGKPLPGYKQALAEYRRRKGAPVRIDRSTTTLVASNNTPTRARNDSQPRDTGNGFGKGLLAALFGGGVDEEEESSADFAAKPKQAPREAAPQPGKQLPGVAVVSNEAEAAPATAAETPADDPAAIIAKLSPGVVPLPAANPRAVAAAEPEAGELPVAVALNVPLPSSRPQSEANAAGEADAVPAATASIAPGLTAVAPLPRPARDQIAVLAAFAENPRRTASGLPENGDKGGRVISVVPRTRPEIMTDGKSGRLKIAAGQEPATPRMAMLSAPKEQRASAVLGNVRTTPKSARPVASQARPEPRARVMPVSADSARWALAVAPVPLPSRPPLATESIREAPAEIYTAGFNSNDLRQGDPHRFTGNAVTFLSVAKFKRTD